MRFHRLPVWLLMMPLLGLAEGPEFWLSPAGNDAGPGTKAQPFATLERARDAVRKARGAAAEAPAVVRLLPGVYLRNKPFELASKDGGAVTYRADGGQR
jgi:hypothetical protein